MSAGAIYGVALAEGSGRSRRPQICSGTQNRADRCLDRGRPDASPMSPIIQDDIHSPARETGIRAGRRGDHRDRYPGAARPVALGPLPHAGGGGARHHLDPRRSRGDARRRRRRRAQGRARAAFHQRRRRLGQQRLSRRRGAGRAVLRLAHRPARPQAAVLHHARASISSPPRPRRCRGISGALRCFGSSPAPASAASTPRSIRRSRS